MIIKLRSFRYFWMIFFLLLGGLLLLLTGSLEMAYERNKGMVLLTKANGMSQVVSYAQQAKDLLQSPQAEAWAGSRRSAYLALLEAKNGEMETVDTLWTSALASSRDPIENMSWLAVAVAIETDGDFERFFSMVGEIPVSEYWYLGYANHLRFIGRVSEAERCYRRAIAMAPEDLEAHRQFADFLEFVREDIPGTAAEYEVIVNLDPTPENMLALARLYRTAERYADAMKLLDKIQALFPGYEERIVIERANIASALGGPTEVLKILEPAHLTFPQSARIWEYLAGTYERMGRIEDALNAAHQAIRLDPEWIWGYWRLVLILQSHYRYEEAVSYLKKMLTMDIKGDRSEVLFLTTLGNVYIQMGSDDLALQAFCRAQGNNYWVEQAEQINQQIASLGKCP